MRVFLALCTFTSTIFAQAPNLNCDQLTWSLPTLSQGDCFEDGQNPNIDNWYCDWTRNSALYYSIFECSPFPYSPAYYSSYVNAMPGVMYSMMQHTTDIMNQCIHDSRLPTITASSWGDIPYMCPDPLSSFYNWIGYGGVQIGLMYDSSCQNIQKIFCEAIFPMSMRTSDGRMEILPHFLAHYDYNNYRMYNNPFVDHNLNQDSFYLEQFVSKVHDCQKDIWSSMVKFDCPTVYQMFNALSYPSGNYRSYTSYTTAYARYLRESPGDNCRIIVDIYGRFLNIKHKGFSEWVIIVLSILGCITFLVFCALLFALIYKLCRHLLRNQCHQLQRLDTMLRMEAK